jgi:hypothetical protein
MDSVAGGHIHRTWRVVTSAGDDVVCQSLNEHVFRDLTSVEENLSRIDRHLAGTGVIATQRRTHDGRVHWGDPSGITWRMSDHVAGSRSARGRLDAASTGNAFGRFLRSLDDLPGGPLRSTIPGFHDLDSRIAAFDAHVRADRLGRLRACRDLVASARRLMSDPSVTADLDAMPWRPVHNDAKVDNLLADDRGRALAVVDLDTVMPGSPLFDLGELLRTGAGDAAEDEPDPGRIEIDDARVSAIVAGFLEGAGPVIDAPTRALAGIAGPRMALENAIRFLGDHLDGDRYFAVHRDGHNLDRGRAQLRVATLLLERRGLIDGVVARQTR